MKLILSKCHSGQMKLSFSSYYSEPKFMAMLTMCWQIGSSAGIREVFMGFQRYLYE